MAGEPWPLAERLRDGAGGAWGPREVLAHVQEMLPFWLGEMERVLDGDGSTPVPFGRIADDDRCASASSSVTGRLPLRVLFGRDRCGAGAHGPAGSRPSSEVEQARVGAHPEARRDAGRVDARTVLIGHAEDHIAQLTDTIATSGRTDRPRCSSCSPCRSASPSATSSGAGSTACRSCASTGRGSRSSASSCRSCSSRGRRRTCSVGGVGEAIYVASTAAVLIAVLRNLRIPGMALIALGAASNLAAIVANGGVMPTTAAALAAAGARADRGVLEQRGRSMIRRSHR